MWKIVVAIRDQVKQMQESKFKRRFHNSGMVRPKIKGDEGMKKIFSRVLYKLNLHMTNTILAFN